jgi:hypothetical protein
MSSMNSCRNLLSDKVRVTAVRDSGMWLDHQGKARVGIGREEDAVDRKYKAIFEQVRFLPPLSTTI